MSTRKPFHLPAIALASCILATGSAAAARRVQNDNDAVADTAGAKISLIEAVNRTQNQIGGRVVRVELSHESGALAYELEVLKGKAVRDVRLDATTGVIVSDKPDDNDAGH